jgi:flagellar FliL protein
MKKKLLIGVLGVVLLAGGGAGAYYFLFGPNPAEAAEEAPSPEPAAIVELDPFITNIADERRARVQVALAVAPVERAAQVQADPLLVARLRDKILTMLAARAYEELSSPSGKEDFRQKVRIAAQRIVADGEVQEALFVDFVIQ